jgi:transcriptional regulator with GAF, ATPase, and Fis domain
MTDLEFQPTLLAVWREAARHSSLALAMGAMVAPLRRQWPQLRLLIRGIDRALPGVVTQADSATIEPGSEPLPCSDDMLERLQRWADRKRVQTAAELKRAEPLVVRALPSAERDACLVGGLADEQGGLGLLIAVNESGASFSAVERERFAALLEPFAAALATHAQLRELATLRNAAEAESERLRSRLGSGAGLDELVGTDGGLKAAFDRIALVAKSDVPVLILGETGAGKEMVAREIHQRSRRREAPFIRVNCGAIPPELIDSELFGHERGSFTGATSQRRGWFERADRGTLLLDEIGDLPPAAQVRLLRVLQDGLIRRVGGEDDIKVDVRIIAATHRDLPHLIQEGQFREDLWYRLATFPIVLPPLRERPADIPALAAHFARRAANRFGLRLQLPGSEDLALLGAYDWPGNVRELAAVMDRAAILGDGQGLQIATALGATPGNPMRPGTLRAAPHATNHRDGGIATLDEAMRAHIEVALTATQGRIEGPHGAARLLDINPHTLRARMRKLGIARRPSSSGADAS